MNDFGSQNELGITESIHYIGPCELAGVLYDLGEYPGLIPGSGRVKGELFEVLDPEVLARLDRFEEYSPTARPTSLYVRKFVPLLKPKVFAWVYIYNRDVSAHPVIDSGNWKEYCTIS